MVDRSGSHLLSRGSGPHKSSVCSSQLKLSRQSSKRNRPSNGCTSKHEHIHTSESLLAVVAQFHKHAAMVDHASMMEPQAWSQLKRGNYREDLVMKRVEHGGHESVNAITRNLLCQLIRGQVRVGGRAHSEYIVPHGPALHQSHCALK